MPPNPRTRRADGTRCDPFSVRVVVTRHARSSEAEHGRVIDGWQYELFAVDLDPVAWPASDAVQQLFGRGGQENRFAQEDRELGLDRIFSYHLPGQEFASVVGLMVWNLRLVAGFRLARPPTEQVPSTLREPRVDRRACAFTPSEEAEEHEEIGPIAPDAAHLALRDEICKVDWPSWEARNPGWAWDPEAARVRCPNGLGLRLITVGLETNGPERSSLMFRASTLGCQACPQKGTCMRGAGKATRKQISIDTDTPLAKRVKRRFRAVRGRPLVDVPRRRPKALQVAIVTAEPAQGPYEVGPALLLPSEARRVFDMAAEDLRVRVTVTLPEPRRRPLLLAETAPRRQHRRKTRAEHLACYDLPDGASLHVDYTMGPRARLLFDQPEPRTAAR